MPDLCYLDGSPVREKDEVVVRPDRSAYVKLILPPGSKLAHDYSSPEGGFVLEFQDGDCQVWNKADEDIRLIRRCPAQKV